MFNLITVQKPMTPSGKALAQNYRSAFAEGAGRDVLKDLIAKFNPAESPYQSEDERRKLGGPWQDVREWAVYRAGQQSVVREILQGIEAAKGGE